MFPADTPCICIDPAMTERLIAAAPTLIEIAGFALGLIVAGSLMSLLLLWLLECRITRQIADYLRGEKRKRKNDEL